MKNNLLLIILLFTIPLLTRGQQIDEQQREILKQEGITEIQVIVTEIDTTTGFELAISKEIAIVNTQGYINNRKTYTAEGKLFSQSFYTFKYDSILTSDRYVQYSSQKQITADVDFVYDKDDRLKKMKIYSDSRLASVITTCYNKEGKIKKRKQKLIGDPKTKALSGTVNWKYFYNKDGSLKHIIKKEIINGKSKTESHETVTADMGDLKSNFVTDLETNQKVLLETLQYDEQNKLTQLGQNFENTVYIHGIKYTKEDQKTKQLIYSKNGLVQMEKHFKNQQLLYSKIFTYSRK